MITPAMEKGVTLVKPPVAQLSIRPNRRPAHLAEGQAKAACAPAVSRSDPANGLPHLIVPVRLAPNVTGPATADMFYRPLVNC